MSATCIFISSEQMDDAANDAEEVREGCWSGSPQHLLLYSTMGWRRVTCILVLCQKTAVLCKIPFVCMDSFLNLQLRVGLPETDSVPNAVPSHPHPESHPIHTDNFAATSCTDFFFFVFNSAVSLTSIGVGIHLAYLLQLSPNSALQLLERNDGLRVKFICTNWNIPFGKELTVTLEIPSCLCSAKGMSYE